MVASKVDTIQYIPKLDGLRFFAIAPVILFHLNIPGFSLGWTGVQLFFVISGFLITTILIKTKENPRYFSNFYFRRILRIFPIYYLCFFFLWVVAYFSNKLGDSNYFFFYIQNYLIGVNKFDVSFPAFNHTWSLAIEEQFYLLWPMIVYFFSKRNLLIICISLFILSFLSRFVLLRVFHYENPFIVYMTLPSQIDCLVSGAIIAILVGENQVKKRILNYFLLGSFLLIVITVTMTGISNYWDVNYYILKKPINLLLNSLLAIFFGSCVVYVLLNNNKNFLNFLNNSILIHLGKISYGLYLYHFIVLTLFPILLAKYNFKMPNDLSKNIVELMLIYLISSFSYHFIESKFLLLKKKFVY